MRLGDGTIARAIARGLKERFPVGGAILETLGPEAVRAISGKPDPDLDTMAQRLEVAAKQNPVLPNNLNIESPWQSGTTLGMGGALLTSLGVIIAMFQGGGEIDPTLLGSQLAILIASGWGLWRRWAPNKLPLFSRK